MMKKMVMRKATPAELLTIAIIQYWSQMATKVALTAILTMIQTKMRSRGRRLQPRAKKIPAFPRDTEGLWYHDKRLRWRTEKRYTLANTPKSSWVSSNRKRKLMRRSDNVWQSTWKGKPSQTKPRL